MSMRSILAAAAFLALAVAPLAAQGHGRGGMMRSGMMGMRGGMMGGGMMGMMQNGGPQPGMLVQSADQLGLTEDQVDQLSALRDKVQAESQAHMQAAMATRQRAAAALQGDASDLDAYTKALEEAASHMVQAHTAMVRASLQAKKILTPEQRGEVEGRAWSSCAWGGMMGGGMTGPGG